MQRRFLTFLFLTLAGSAALFVLYVVGVIEDGWMWYYKLYLLLALTQIWYTFSLLFYGELKAKNRKLYAGEKILVVMPCFNEEPALFEKALASVLAADGKKRIVVIDDGSDRALSAKFKRIAKRRGARYHRQFRNQGKRAALVFAIEHFLRKERFVVTMDSDTVFDRRALVSLVSVLKQNGVAAASGDVQLLNEKHNLLTRMIGGYYWSALHIQRKSQSAHGCVNCCSGAIAAFRTSQLKKVIRRFAAQEFLGKPCTYGEDRHLTNLILRRGWKVVFEPRAIAYTNTPDTFRAFMKQQQRWRRGFLVESMFALSFAWKVNRLFFVELLLWELLLPIASFGIVLLLTIASLLNPEFFVKAILPSMILLFVIRQLPAFFWAPKKIPGLFLFTIFSHFISYWIGVHALFTLQNRSWGTR